MSEERSGVSDQELARQTQAGSLDAFETLVLRYEGRIYGFLLRMCGDVENARELTQETFVRGYQAIGQFNPDRSFATWLFAIARNQCIDHQRRAARISAEPVPVQIDTEDPAELAARQDERASLWDLAQRSLPELQFQALWLRYAEEMDIAAVATVMRKTKTHVKVLLFRARQVLSRELSSSKVVENPKRNVAVGGSPLVLVGQKGKV